MNKIFYIGSVLLAALAIAGCGDKETKQPAPSTPAVERPATLSAGQKYDRILDALDKAPFTYGYLQGLASDPRDSKSQFYEDIGEFLRYNPDGLPASVGLSDAGASRTVVLSNSEGWNPSSIQGAYTLHLDDGLYACAPPSAKKDIAFKELVRGFERDKPVDRNVVKLLMRNLTVDCY